MRPNRAHDREPRYYSTAPYGVYEPAFNLVSLAEAAGASYVARWTTFHLTQLA